MLFVSVFSDLGVRERFLVNNLLFVLTLEALGVCVLE